VKPLIVQKYGGTSVARPDQIKSIAQQVAKLQKLGHSVLLVVSAMGKTTDELVELAYKVSSTPNRRELDMLLSTGERVSMALMSMALNDVGVKAISFTGSQAGVFTDDLHSNARIIDIKPIRVEAELAKGNCVVLAGFQGVSPTTKEVTTLGRGGSDTTAVAMAAYFKAEHCEIRKDVEGVYSADPHIVSNAKHIPNLHYSELLELTFWGAKVLHYRSVELACALEIPLVIALSHGDGLQTIINGEKPMFEQPKILSVNSHKDVKRVFVKANSANEALSQFHSGLNQRSLPWPQVLDLEPINGGEWRILITGPSETLGAIEGSQSTFKINTDSLSTVTATCRGTFASDLAEKISSALKTNNIQVERLLLSPMSVTALVKSSDREKAIQSIHSLVV
jgi:aspartate kinase